MSMIKYRSGEDDTKNPSYEHYWQLVLMSSQAQRETLEKIRKRPDADKLCFLIFSRMNVKEFRECEKLLGVDEEDPPFDDILSSESCELLLDKFKKEIDDQPVLITNTILYVFSLNLF
jgi:hypothetical protein